MANHIADQTEFAGEIFREERCTEIDARYSAGFG